MNKISYLFAMATVCFLAACVPNQTHELTRFKDFPVPKTAQFDQNHSAIIGTGNEWIGKACFILPYGQDEVIPFYEKRMSKYGWKQIHSIKEKIQYSVYKKNDRVIQLIINETQANGTELTVLATNIQDIKKNFKQ